MKTIVKRGWESLTKRLLGRPGEGRHSNLKIAVISTLIAHLVLLSMLPGVSGFQFSTLLKNSGLNVFLETEDENFDRSLNRTLPLSSDRPSLIEQQLSATSTSGGEQPNVSEESIEVRSNYTGSGEEAPSGKHRKAQLRTRIITSWSALRSFTDREATQYADANPHDVERFGRSFNSLRSYRNRNQTVGYRDQYGDYYVRDQSTVGDICFKQERVLNPDEAATRTVYFFRCGEKPLKLDIASPKPLG